MQLPINDYRLSENFFLQFILEMKPVVTVNKQIRMYAILQLHAFNFKSLRSEKPITTICILY